MLTADYERLFHEDDKFTADAWMESIMTNYPVLYDSRHSSLFLQPDAIDEINAGRIDPIPDVDNSSSESLFQNSISESTDNASMNSINREFKSFLDSRSKSFVNSLKHTDFEDGMENDAIREVKGYLELNAYATLLWMHSVYADNQKDADILSGLLRIIGMTVDSDETNMLLPMIKAGLADPNSKTQETALMVIEQWRTKNCLDALETALDFSSAWIGNYAERVKSELREELRSVVATDDQRN